MSKRDQDELLRRDRMIYGMSFTLNGERVDPERVPTARDFRADAEPRRFCDEFLESEDPHGGTYCKLLAGHDGECSAHYPPSQTP